MSTPTSGESSGGDGKHGDHHHHHHDVSTSHFPQPIHPQANEGGWSVSVGNPMIHRQQFQLDVGDMTISHGDAGDVDPTSTSETQAGRYGTMPYASAIKLLVSNNMAGSIIGRAGQTISDLQTQSSARIKLSQTGDFYPGTQDRVCLVQGRLDNVKKAVELLLERLFILQEQQHSQPYTVASESRPLSEFKFVVRVLVPSSSCGMIIGKSGANIKHMEDSSGVSSVRLSPKEGADPSNPTAAIVSGNGERVVTLTGPSLECCTKCVSIILDCMAANQEISRYANMTTSYSRVVLPGTYAPMAQPGRPMIVVPAPTADWDRQGHYNHFSNKRSSSQPDLSHTATVDAQKGATRISSESPSRGAVSSGNTAHAFNSSSFHDGSPSYGTDSGPSIPSPPVTTRGPPPNPTGGPVYLVPQPLNAPVDHSVMSQSSSAPDLLTLQFHDSVRVSNSPTTPTPVEFSHLAQQLPQPTSPGFTAQVIVPDTLIGSILGRGGRTLNDLQMHSNTRIRISQRGEYMPGTRNRIVTIRGPTAHSVSLAQFLMSQRMALPTSSNFSPQTPAASAAPAFHHPSQLQSTTRFPSPHHAAPLPSQHAIAPIPQAATASPHSFHLHHHQQSSEASTYPFSDSAFPPSTASSGVSSDQQAAATSAQSSLPMAPPQD